MTEKSNQIKAITDDGLVVELVLGEQNATRRLIQHYGADYPENLDEYYQKLWPAAISTPLLN